MVLFSMTCLAVVSLAVDAQSLATDSEASELDALRLKIQAGLIWLIFLLSGSIGIERGVRTTDSAVHRGLLLVPASRVTLYYSRVISTLSMILVMEVATALFFAFLYNLDLSWEVWGKFALFALAGTLGYVALGVTIALMLRGVRSGEVFLRLLTFPLIIPLFMAVVEATYRLFAGKPMATTSLTILICFDLIYLAAGQIFVGPLTREETN